MALVPGQQHPGEGSPPFSWHAPTDAVNEEDVDRVWRQLLNVLNVGQPQAQAKSSLGQPQPPQHSTAADVTNGSPRSALTSSAHYADTGGAVTADHRQLSRSAVSAVSLATSGKLQALKAMRLSAAAQRQTNTATRNPQSMLGSSQSGLRQSWPAHGGSQGAGSSRQVLAKPAATGESAADKERYNLRRTAGTASTGAGESHSALAWQQRIQAAPALSSVEGKAGQGGTGAQITASGAKRAAAGPVNGKFDDAAPQPRPRLTATPHKAGVTPGQHSAAVNGVASGRKGAAFQALTPAHSSSQPGRHGSDRAPDNTSASLPGKWVPGGAAAGVARTGAASRARPATRVQALRQSAPLLQPPGSGKEPSVTRLDAERASGGSSAEQRGASRLQDTQSSSLSQHSHDAADRQLAAGPAGDVQPAPDLPPEPLSGVARSASTQDAGLASARPGSSSSVASYRSNSGSSGATSDTGRMSLLLSLAGPAGTAEAGNGDAKGSGSSMTLPLSNPTSLKQHRLKHSSSSVLPLADGNFLSSAAPDDTSEVQQSGAQQSHGWQQRTDGCLASQQHINSQGAGAGGEQRRDHMPIPPSPQSDPQHDPMCLAAASLLLDAFAAGVPLSSESSPTLPQSAPPTASPPAGYGQSDAHRPAINGRQEETSNSLQHELGIAFDPVVSALLAAAAEAEAEVYPSRPSSLEPSATTGMELAHFRQPLEAQIDNQPWQQLLQELDAQHEGPGGATEPQPSAPRLEAAPAVSKNQHGAQQVVRADDGPGMPHGQQQLQQAEEQAGEQQDAWDAVPLSEADVRAVELYHASLQSRALRALVDYWEHRHRRRYAFEVATVWHHARLASGTLLTWWELACGAPRVHQLQQTWNRRLLSSCLHTWRRAVPPRPTSSAEDHTQAPGLAPQLSITAPHPSAPACPTPAPTPARLSKPTAGSAAAVTATALGVGAAADGLESSAALAAAKAAISAALQRAAAALSAEAQGDTAPAMEQAPSLQHIAVRQQPAAPVNGKLAKVALGAAAAEARTPSSTPSRTVAPQRAGTPKEAQAGGRPQPNQQQLLPWPGGSGRGVGKQQPQPAVIEAPRSIMRGKSLLTELEENVDWFAAATVALHDPSSMDSQNVLAPVLPSSASAGLEASSSVAMVLPLSQPNLGSDSPGLAPASPQSRLSHRRSRSSLPSTSAHDEAPKHSSNGPAARTATPTRNLHQRAAHPNPVPAAGPAIMAAWGGAAALREVDAGSPPSWLVRSRDMSAPQRQARSTSPAGSPQQQQYATASHTSRRSTGAPRRNLESHLAWPDHTSFGGDLRFSLNAAPLEAWHEVEALEMQRVAEQEEEDEYPNWHDDSEPEASDVSDPAGYRSYIVQPGSIVKVASGTDQQLLQGHMGSAELEDSWSDNPAYDEDSSGAGQGWLRSSGSQDWEGVLGSWVDRQNDAHTHTAHNGLEHSGRNNPMFDRQNSSSTGGAVIQGVSGAAGQATAAVEGASSPLQPSRETNVPATPLYEALQQIMLM